MVEEKRGLIVDGDVRLLRRNKAWRRRRISGRDELDIETGVREVALLFGDDQRRVVGIDEPLQQNSQLVGGHGRAGNAGGGNGETDHENQGTNAKHRRSFYMR